MHTVFDILEEYVDADREQIRSNLCVAYGAVGTPDAIERLERLGLNDESPAVRNRAAAELLALPESFRNEVVRRLHAGLFSSEAWLRNFELLQCMARDASRPISTAIGSSTRATIDLLRLNWRLRTTRTSPFFLFREFPLLSLILAGLVLPALLVVWFSLVAEGTTNQLGEMLGFAILGAYCFGIVFAIGIPPRIAYLRPFAAYADAIWITVISILSVLALLLAADLTSDPLLIRSVSFPKLMLISMVFLALPMAARLGVAAAALHTGRFVCVLSATVAGAGATCIAVLAAATIFSQFGTDGDLLHEAASTTSLFGIAGAVYFSTFLGFLEPVGAHTVPYQADRSDRRLWLGFFSILLLAVSVMVAVPPPYKKSPSDVSVQEPAAIELGAIVVGLGPQAASETRRGVASGQLFDFQPTVPGELTLTLTADKDVVILFDGDRIDDDPPHTPPTETLVRQLTPRPSQPYRAEVRFFSTDPPLGGAVRSPEEYLWEFSRRFGWWFGLVEASPWGKRDQALLSLEIAWSP